MFPETNIAGNHIGKPASVSQAVPQGYFVLAMNPEFRNVLSNIVVSIDKSLLDQFGEAACDHWLGDRRHQED
jgi:hypothetical protein